VHAPGVYKNGRGCWDKRSLRRRSTPGLRRNVLNPARRPLPCLQSITRCPYSRSPVQPAQSPGRALGVTPTTLGCPLSRDLAQTGPRSFLDSPFARLKARDARLTADEPVECRSCTKTGFSDLTAPASANCEQRCLRAPDRVSEPTGVGQLTVASQQRRACCAVSANAVCRLPT